MEDVVPIRMLLVDEHRLFREGLRRIFLEAEDLEVVGDAGDARTAYAAADELRPDLAILDVVLPGASGIAATRELLRRDSTRKVLVLTALREEQVVADALDAGAAGYVLKEQSCRDLLDAVRGVAAGQHYLSPAVCRPLVDRYVRRSDRPVGDRHPLDPLSHREREVFDLLVRGHPNSRVGKELCISVKTVETHRGHILRKLGLHSLVDLIRFAAQHNLLFEPRQLEVRAPL
jgi:two-component system response regulator NreC